MRRLRRELALLSLVSLPAAALLLFGGGCGSDSAPGTATTDAAAVETGSESGASADASTDSTMPIDGGALDAACAATKIVPSTGETCVGFGDGTGCDTACGLPKYGYVCFNGGPPGFAGCVQASSTGSFGDTYCCPDNACVAQPDQDTKCASAGSGKPHRYQCPPDGMGGKVAPPSGCVDGGSGGTALERFYCCP